MTDRPDRPDRPFMSTIPSFSTVSLFQEAVRAPQACERGLVREVFTKEAVALPQYSIGCTSNDFAADTILQADVAVAAARNFDDHACAQCPHHVKT